MISGSFCSKSTKRTDPVLASALIVATVLCLVGITWGRYEPWNTDQLALRELFGNPAEPFNPGWFYRPPLQTYLVWFLVRLPLASIGDLLAWGPSRLATAELVGARLVTLGLFLATILLAYRLVRRATGVCEARLLALTPATSAGLIAHAHFLTVDLPLAFWMIAATAVFVGIAERPRAGRYALGGLLIGLASATKYNGLVLVCGLLAAHAMAVSDGERSDRLAHWLDKRLALGLLAVPVAFLLANPYALLDWRDFLGGCPTYAPVARDRGAEPSFSRD